MATPALPCLSSQSVPRFAAWLDVGVCSLQSTPRNNGSFNSSECFCLFNSNISSLGWVGGSRSAAWGLSAQRVLLTPWTGTALVIS